MDAALGKFKRSRWKTGHATSDGILDPDWVAGTRQCSLSERKFASRTEGTRRWAEGPEEAGAARQRGAWDSAVLGIYSETDELACYNIPPCVCASYRAVDHAAHACHGICPASQGHLDANDSG